MKRKLSGFPLMFFLGMIAFASFNESCINSFQPEESRCISYVNVGNSSGASIYVGASDVKPDQFSLCANGGTRMWIHHFNTVATQPDCFAAGNIDLMFIIKIVDSNGTVIFEGNYIATAMQMFYTWDGKTMKIGK